MEIDIIIPSVGESIKEAILVEWYKKEGELVKKDELLFLIETDKVTVEVQSEAAGSLTIKAKEGDTVAIGSVVGSINTEAGAAVTQKAASDKLEKVPEPELVPETPPPAKEELLGVVCLNVGSIPSKALLDSSEYYHLAREHFKSHGVITGNVKLDLRQMIARKNEVVKDLTDQVRVLLDGNGVTIFHGRGEILDAGLVMVEQSTGKRKKRLLLTCKQRISSWQRAADLFPFREWTLTVIELSVQQKPSHLIRFPKNGNCR